MFKEIGLFTLMPTSKKAKHPEDLDRLFMDLGNAGDVEGIVALYESNATLAFPQGQITVGRKFEVEVRAAIRNGDFALTSTRTSNGVTVEVAHRQPDGSWLWIIDQPNALG